MKNGKVHKIFEKLGRKNIIKILVIAIVVLIVMTIALIVQAIKENQNRTNIVYAENGLVNYNVHLRKNNFFEKEYLEENMQYIASLIDYVTANFKYQLQSSDNNSSIGNYTYKIVAETKVVNEANQNTIFKFDEDIIEAKKLHSSDSKIYINNEIKIDYNKYNDIISKFINVYNLNDITSTVTINMYVNVEGVSKSNAPVASLVIPLTTKTVAIDIESNSVNATDINVYKEIASKEKLYLAVLTFTLTALVIIELNIYINDTKDEQSVYQMQIKKILLNYGSYIQKINNEFDYDDYQIIEMKTFEDLLQIRDTISQPILMKQNIKENETIFIIPSKERVVYTYKLKVKDVKQNRSNYKKGLKV